jgi:hypothetical protein
VVWGVRWGRRFRLPPFSHLINAATATLIELSLVLSDHNGMSNDVGNSRMPEPKRPGGALIQRAGKRHRVENGAIFS